jgi:hypothetical protein
MRLRAFSRAIALALGLASPSATASTQDATLCFLTAERVEAGETLDEAEKKEAHEACHRALAATGSVVQKYQFQEGDFAITGAHR